MVGRYAIRKGLLSFLWAGAIFMFASCGKTAQTSSNEDTLDRIRKTGQIEACTAVYPPYVIKDSKTGALSGVNVDMMNLIANKMNAKVNWHETTWGNATAELGSKHCDVMAVYFFALIPRALSVAFTQPPLGYLGLSAIARRNDRRFRNVQNVLRLDRPDVTIVVPTGGAGDIFVKENLKRVKVKRIDVEASDLTRYCLEVSSNRADAAISDAATIARYAKEHPELVDLFGKNQFSMNPLNWAVRQDDVKWLHFLETALQFLDTQGTIAQLENKYNAHLLHLVKTYKLQ